MIALFCLFLALFASPFKSKSRLEAENAVLRHQLIILQRKVRGASVAPILSGHPARLHRHRAKTSSHDSPVPAQISTSLRKAGDLRTPVVHRHGGNSLR